jgi:hypothetical protein
MWSQHHLEQEFVVQLQVSRVSYSALRQTLLVSPWACDAWDVV